MIPRLSTDRNQSFADTLPGSERFQMCHSVGTNESERPSSNAEARRQSPSVPQPRQWQPAQQVGKLQVIAEAVESSLVLVERLKKTKL